MVTTHYISFTSFITEYIYFLCLDVFQIIAFDELKTDYKNPIDQCNSLNPVSIFDYIVLQYNKNIVHANKFSNDF